MTSFSSLRDNACILRRLLDVFLLSEDPRVVAAFAVAEDMQQVIGEVGEESWDRRWNDQTSRECTKSWMAACLMTLSRLYLTPGLYSAHSCFARQ